MTDHSTPDAATVTALLTIDELCRTSHVEAAWIMELVEHGAIDPAGGEPPDWRFEALTIVRVAKAKRLERDLSLNPPGIALVLDLLEQIDELRSQLRATRGT